MKYDVNSIKGKCLKFMESTFDDGCSRCEEDTEGGDDVYCTLHKKYVRELGYNIIAVNDGEYSVCGGEKV